MRYVVTWIEEKSATIVAPDIKAAAAHAAKAIATAGGKGKLLSVYEAAPREPTLPPPAGPLAA